MRDLIEKQTASLAQRGGAAALYSPERLRGPEEGEVLDAEPKGKSESEVILKDILGILKKTYNLMDNVDQNVDQLVTAMNALNSTVSASAQSLTPTGGESNADSLKKVYDDGVPKLEMSDRSNKPNTDTVARVEESKKQVPLISSSVAAVSNADEGLRAEAAAEASDKVDRQIQLLEIIAGALTGKDQKKEIDKKQNKKEDSDTDSGKGAIKGMMKGLLKGFALTALIGAVVNGLVDGFKEFSESGDIGKALIAGLGGMLDFLTFGLINKDTLNYIIDNFNSMVDEYIVAPISDFIDMIGKAFDDYIATPIGNFVDSIASAFNDYIATPITDFAKWYVDTLSSIVTTLVIDPLSYMLTTISDAFQTYIKKPFDSMVNFAKNIFGGGDDAKDVKPKDRTIQNFDAMGNPTGFTEDNTTAAASSPAVKVSVDDKSKSLARIVPIDADKPDAAMRVGAFAQLPNTPVALSSGRSLDASSAVYDGSANNIAAKEAVTAKGATQPIIVNAPTNVSNKQNITMPASIRNMDPGFTSYKSKVM